MPLETNVDRHSCTELQRVPGPFQGAGSISWRFNSIDILKPSVKREGTRLYEVNLPFAFELSYFLAVNRARCKDDLTMPTELLCPDNVKCRSGNSCSETTFAAMEKWISRPMVAIFRNLFRHAVAGSVACGEGRAYRQRRP